MEVVVCDESHRASWDDFAGRVEGCWHYHLFGWRKVIESVYAHECPYLMALSGKEVMGVLPLAVVKSRWFGDSVTSLPFVDSSGVVAVNPEAMETLVAGAEKIARDSHVDYMELRQSREVQGRFRVDTHKLSLTMQVKETVEEQWESLSSERRNRIRKARNAGLRAEFGSAAALTDFYRVWCQNMRDLGSPVHSRLWFEMLLEEFADTMGVVLILEQNECVGAAVWIQYKRVLSVPWVSSLRQHFSKHPNDLMYWEAIKFAVERGCQRFDFGRSTANSGNHTYKVRWGAEQQPLYWQYRSLRGGEPALPNESSFKYRLAMDVWKRIPLGLANWIGPRVRREITS